MSFENRDCLENAMKIKELRLINFRGFQDIDIKFPSSNLAVFIGINGAGKSSILDAVAIFLSRFISKITKSKEGMGLDLILTDDDIKLTDSDHALSKIYKGQTFNSMYILDNIYGLWQISKHHSLYLKENDNGYTELIEHEYNSKYFFNLLKNGKIKNLPTFIYYQTNRTILNTSLVFLKSKKKKFHFNQFFTYENAFTKNITDLSDFISWFRLEEDIENEMKIKQKDFNAVNKNLEIVRRAITVFLNQFPACEFSELHIERRSQDKNFSFHSAEESSLVIKKNGQDLKIEQLSAGEQIVLMMVSDIARRLAIANPSLPDPLQGQGIVLIDEIELHLHPQWQRQIIPCLLHTFPNIQFIVTTHSPQVLGNVEQEEVFILEDFKIVEKTPHTKGRDSNSVLYELLGVEERPKEYKDKLSQLYRLIDDTKFSEAKAILAKLTEKFGEHDTEIVRANMHLNLAEEDMNEIHQEG
jgi:predicted ATP-binding protein involved in virulence